MAIATFYPNDVARLEKLGLRLPQFEIWFAQLERQHGLRGWPYGKGSLAKTTGLGGWIEFFEEGFTPSNALDEDLNDYG